MMTYKRTVEPFYDGLLQFLIGYLQHSVDAQAEEFDQESRSILPLIKETLRKLTFFHLQNCLSTLVNFVYQNIQSQRLEMRLAAMIVFDAVVYAGKREEVENLVLTGYESFLSQFNDPNLIIQKFNLFVFRSLCKMQPYVLAIDDRLRQLLELMLHRVS